MALERLNALAAVRVPYLDRAVPGGGRQPGRVMGEGYREDPAAVALECLNALTATHVP